MGCACKVEKQLSYLQERYGEKMPESKKTDIKGIVKKAILKVPFAIMTIAISPFLLLFILLRKILTSKPIKIDKLFNIN